MRNRSWLIPRCAKLSLCPELTSLQALEYVLAAERCINILHDKKIKTTGQKGLLTSNRCLISSVDIFQDPQLQDLMFEIVVLKATVYFLQTNFSETLIVVEEYAPKLPPHLCVFQINRLLTCAGPANCCATSSTCTYNEVNFQQE